MDRLGTCERHGLRGHPIYRVWDSVKQRCHNENTLYYENYGGRGISICGEWDKSFSSFYDWAKNEWEPGLCIDRIDNDGNYEPENCRFITRAESNRNQRLLRRCNTSGYRGVSWHKDRKSWSANISINGKSKHLGLFDSAKLAAIRYDVEAFLLNDGRPMNFIIG